MISYSLNCPDNHRFDSWFQSAAAYDALVKAGHVNCPVCGSTDIGKALMAPAVRPGRSQSMMPSPAIAEAVAAKVTPLQTPTDDREAALAALRRQVEANSDYVGLNFVAEARAIHDGNAPARSIYGEARIDEARKLLEDGVPVAPLPFLPMRKVN